jgi:glucokinase
MSTALALAVDVGGSSVRAARVGPSGIAGATAARPLDAASSHAEIMRMTTEVVRAVDGGGASAIGIAVPGFVGHDGRVHGAQNLPALNGADPVADLAGIAGERPVVAVVDLPAAALAESRLGRGRGLDRFLCVALGTGANAALVVDGEVLDVADGGLGDAGHICVDPAGPPCTCGGRGCLEALASGAAFARDGAALGLPSARAVIDAARAGDPGATAIVERAGVALGRAIAIWAALLLPERVAIAGGLAACGELLLKPARRELARVATPHIADRLEIVLADLGSHASLTGAGLYGLRALQRGAS